MHSQVKNQIVVPSVDAKPASLNWSQEFHQQFIHAVSQLGGVDKATPKSVLQIMGLPELTLYHLKSHMQKYRFAKNQDRSNSNGGGNPVETSMNGTPCGEEDGTRVQLNETMLQMEVQRHLQLRIEAQGKYLQSVLQKAQETLAVAECLKNSSFSSSSSSSSFTQMQTQQHVACSNESCLTSSSPCDRNEESDETSPDCRTSASKLVKRNRCSNDHEPKPDKRLCQQEEQEGARSY
ncbi:hypothetical protein J5N97_006648 [Dioscorea zingiberensis]|uniref:MYB-CC type transcription factor LHEQLE-containing domain-containing protein n=1 Tax=Dioscorea zingiberensis TaxID=325984 RepID=A0A9D5HU80_9LILI|nr:hypothetical protein J5N97_006648 [Dioscorea zingiberensis]